METEEDGQVEEAVTDLTVANTILQQLGGRRFCMMTGAKGFLGTNNSLAFRIGRNCKGVNYVKVTLDPSDTYTVEFMRVSLRQNKVLATCSDIYWDSLQECFTRNTGMETHL